MDINDPLLYDLVINTDKIGIEKVISHIIELAKSNEIIERSIDALSFPSNEFGFTEIHF